MRRLQNASISMATAAFSLLLLAAADYACAGNTPVQPLAVEEDGTIHVPAFDLPVSTYFTPQEQSLLRLRSKPGPCPAPEHPYENLPAIRECTERAFIPYVAKIRSKYNVRSEAQTINGVATEVFTPSEGVLRENRSRVLMNLHGGGFLLGAKYGARPESIPIAAVAKIKVVGVDYRLAPEHKFPSAVEDAIAVYRGLLARYSANSIGVYGCSAGALLTAEMVARLQKEKLPLPGAVGLFCGGAAPWTGGDSAHFGSALAGVSLASSALDKHPYFEDADLDDPLVFPAKSTPVIAGFPPTLLISSTRDLLLSSTVHTHSLLIGQGIEAELHVWEGLGHGSVLYDIDLPQSEQAYRVIARFFISHLGD